MQLLDFLAELDALLLEATNALAAAADSRSLEAARICFLGVKSGRLKDVQKHLGLVDKSDKPAAGKRFNEVKASLEAALAGGKARFSAVGSGGIRVGGSAAAGTRRTIHRSFADSPNFSERVDAMLVVPDLTLPGVRPTLGHLHPVTQTIDDLKDIMGRLGFTVADGPEVEDEWHNFEALNIPLDHPARDPLENFYLAVANAQAQSGSAGERPMLLRSQTSTVQIRVMEKTRPPVRIISLGRVYRPDTADATHYPMFHQIEGLLVDRGVTMADLKSVLRLFAANYFGGDDVHIRFRPSFFPFTEPSVEVDMSWRGGWLEMGGAGMVDPAVLAAVGYDPEEVTGFAFGLGIERICMNRHRITDIREFYKNDVRFLHQF